MGQQKASENRKYQEIYPEETVSSTQNYDQSVPSEVEFSSNAFLHKELLHSSTQAKSNTTLSK